MLNWECVESSSLLLQGPRPTQNLAPVIQSAWREWVGGDILEVYTSIYIYIFRARGRYGLTNVFPRSVAVSLFFFSLFFSFFFLFFTHSFVYHRISNATGMKKEVGDRQTDRQTRRTRIERKTLSPGNALGTFWGFIYFRSNCCCYTYMVSLPLVFCFSTYIVDENQSFRWHRRVTKHEYMTDLTSKVRHIFHPASPMHENINPRNLRHAWLNPPFSFFACHARNPSYSFGLD